MITRAPLWKVSLLLRTIALIAAVAVLVAQQRSQEQPLAHRGSVVDDIRRLGLGASQVMEHALFLTDVAVHVSQSHLVFVGLATGPRRDCVTSASMSIRSRSCTAGVCQSGDLQSGCCSPQPSMLIGAAVPWSASTRGEVIGEPIIARLLPTDITRETYEDYVGKYKGRLRGRFVLLSPARDVPAPTQPYATRLTDFWSRRAGARRS